MVYPGDPRYVAIGQVAYILGEARSTVVRWSEAAGLVRRDEQGHRIFDIVDVADAYARKFPEAVRRQQLLTPRQAAELLGISVDAAMERAVAGVLSSYRLNAVLVFFPVAGLPEDAQRFFAQSAAAGPVGHRASPPLSASAANAARLSSERGMTPYELNGQVFYDTGQVSILFGVSGGTVGNWADHGQIPAIQDPVSGVRRFPKEQIDAIVMRLRS